MSILEAREGQKQRGERFPRIGNVNLGYFETKIIGGSIPFDLYQDVEDNKGIVPDVYFQPEAFLTGKSSTRCINEARKKGYLRGTLPIFGESILDLPDSYEMITSLPAVDSKSGIGKREWIIFMRDENGQVHSDYQIFSRLSLSGKMSTLLDTEILNDGMHLVLKTACK